MKTEAFGRLPVNASGSSSTYEADGMWYNNSQVNYAYVGGGWGNDLMVGPFCAVLHATASYSHSTCGAALSCNRLLLRKQRGEDGRTLGSPGKRKQLNIRGIHCAQRVCRRQLEQ